MARINRFYLLIASLTFSHSYSTSAYSFTQMEAVLVNTEKYCAGQLDRDSSEPCHICAPFASWNSTTPDGESVSSVLTQWVDNNVYVSGIGTLTFLTDMCAPSDCVVNTSGQYIHFLGEQSRALSGYPSYTCSEHGWVTCSDRTYNNGTFEDCCDPQIVNGTLTCTGGYARAYCNTGYSGTFTGRATDCTKGTSSTCSDLVKYNGTFKSCCNPSQSGTQWKCSSYSSKFCNSGYYGTFDGKSTDCTKCPDGYERAVEIDGSGNWIGNGTRLIAQTSNATSISGCYVAGPLEYVDNRGKFRLAGSCWW